MSHSQDNKRYKNNYVAWCYDRLLNQSSIKKGLLNERNDGQIVNFSLITMIRNTSHLCLYWSTFRSVIKQHYKHWNWLLIIDDNTTLLIKIIASLFSLHPNIQCKSIKGLSDVNALFRTLPKKSKIPTHDQYLAFIKIGDTLSEDALLIFNHQIQHKKSDYLYCDDDVINELGWYERPHFKTDFNCDLLQSNNYIGDFFVVKKSTFINAGGLQNDSVMQFYDVNLRISEITNQITHICDVLYHRHHSNVMNYANANDDLDEENVNRLHISVSNHRDGKEMLQSSLVRRGVNSKVVDSNILGFYHTKRELTRLPKVSIIIPFKDQSYLLRQVVESIIQLTDYENYEIIGVSNNSVEDATYAIMESLQGQYQNSHSVHFYEHNIDFNFSKLVNFGVEKASGEHVVLLNNDIKILNSYWLEAMLVQSMRDDVAAVGTKLFYSNNTIQHAGIAIGLGKQRDGGSAGHIHQGMPYYAKGYFNQLNCIQEISAVTAAMLMVKKSIYTELHGFEDDKFAIAFNDVDFCLRAIEKGYKNIYTPHAKAYHFESVSRGHDISDEKLARLTNEKNALRERHPSWFTEHDPFYNKQFDYDCDNFTVATQYETLC